ncbi:MAG: amino acid ABC transporter permease [Oscillospiraceae bacterium]|nr:amino acid ABC transporter permease [Oscillospiraceae bacterium]
MHGWLEGLQRQFVLNFINEDRWRLLLNGLGVTLRITFFALLMGLAIGVVVAIVRSTHDKNIHSMRPGPVRLMLVFFNTVCRIYLTVIRGTPVVLQLLIFYFVILTSIRSGVVVGTIAFGINAGAYIAEIFRSGIMSVDGGQFEAGRSLGFNYIQTMRHIIVPQAFKIALPTLANEFIVLLKETAVVGYVAVQDLTKAGDIIRGRTYSAFMPLIAIALVYLTLVMFFTWLVSKLERRLRSNER